MMTATHAENQPEAEGFARLNSLTRNLKVAMLTTRGADGTLHCRPMAKVGKKVDRTLWFYAAAHSEKCREVQEEAEVNVAYADPRNHRYVSVSGRARQVNDPELAKELWTPWIRLWFPHGLQDPDLVLLEVTAEWAEYWEVPTLSTLPLLRLAKIMLSRKPHLADFISHEKFKIGEPEPAEAAEKTESASSRASAVSAEKGPHGATPRHDEREAEKPASTPDLAAAAVVAEAGTARSHGGPPGVSGKRSRPHHPSSSSRAR